VACAVAEAALASDLTDGRLWTVEVPESVHDLAERTGLSAREVRDGLRLLTDAGVAERVVARGGTRLRIAEPAVAAGPVLARVAWTPLRLALHDRGASVAPALAVTRAIAARTAGVRGDGLGDPVALTQQELVATTLFGRTAVVAALDALERVGALVREARRGTWTECRLCPAVFSGVGYRTGAPDGAPAGRGAVAADVERGAAPSPAGAVPVGAAPAALPARPAPVAPGAPVSPPSIAAPGAGMAMEVGGIVVPLQPGMSVQPPPGAQLVVEVDPDGRRYLRIDAAIRVGPLP
jgi:DNA-binding Lrp family transcriptional regulator